MKIIRLKITLEQLAESLKGLCEEELEELEFLLLRDELDRRSQEAKERSLGLEELESLADV